MRRKRTIKELIYIEQERDNFRKLNARQEVRLRAVDPERFIDRIDELRGEGKFDQAEEEALAFSNTQNEAFGLAAEVLTEQRILDSGKHDWAVGDAQRFAAIGLAANPESIRLQELQKLADTRAENMATGEPIETLDWQGLSGVDLKNLAISLSKAGKHQLAEVAARRSVPLAAIRTGEMSSNYAAALTVHADCLQTLGDLAGAEPLMREAMAIDKKALGADHTSYAIDLNNLAQLLQAKGDLAGAEPLLREAMVIDKKALGADHTSYARDLNNLAQLLQAKGDLAAAEPLMREAVAVFEAALGAEHPNSKIVRGNLEDLLSKLP